MASTGFKRDADQAGIKPDNSPIRIETPTPNRIFPNVRIKSKSNMELTTNVSMYTMSRPTIPPISDKKTASKRNCSRIK